MACLLEPAIQPADATHESQSGQRRHTTRAAEGVEMHVRRELGAHLDPLGGHVQLVSAGRELT